MRSCGYVLADRPSTQNYDVISFSCHCGTQISLWLNAIRHRTRISTAPGDAADTQRANIGLPDPLFSTTADVLSRGRRRGLVSPTTACPAAA